MTMRPLPPLGLTVAFALLSGTVLALRLPTIPPPWLIVAVLALGMVARARGALTIAIANNASTPLLDAALHPILLGTGRETIRGDRKSDVRGQRESVRVNI